MPTSKLKPQNSSRESGFTLIELLIVVLISAMLATLVITYSDVGRDEESLSVGSTAIAQTILLAKSLSINTYENPTGPRSCGYGVLFDINKNTYSLVSYDPSGPTCPSESALEASGVTASTLIQYSPATWQEPVTQGARLENTGSSGNPLTLVIFYPPDPATLVSQSVCSQGSSDCVYSFSVDKSGSVYIGATDGGATQAITVSSIGQVEL